KPFGTIELARGREHRADEPLHVGHERMMIDPDSVPLDHGELGVVPTAGLAVAIHLCDLPDIAAACCDEALHAVLRRRVEEPLPVQRARLDAREVNVTDGRRYERGRFDFE